MKHVVAVELEYGIISINISLPFSIEMPPEDLRFCIFYNSLNLQIPQFLNIPVTLRKISEFNTGPQSERLKSKIVMCKCSENWALMRPFLNERSRRKIKTKITSNIYNVQHLMLYCTVSLSLPPPLKKRTTHHQNVPEKIAISHSSVNYVFFQLIFKK